MKLTDKIAQQPENKPFFSFEFFPPRTDQGFNNLTSRISRLATLKPLAVSVTWGAGGHTKDRSMELASITQNEYGLDTVLHLTCTNMEIGTMDVAVKEAKDKGIRNILALRGDPPRGQEEWIPSDPRFVHGVDLVKYLRETQGDYFCIGVAAYPDGHPDKLLNEEQELDYLKEKVDAGADFIVTQLFYDVDGFLSWLKKVGQKGIKVPIIPGIMPIQTYSSFQRLTKLCGTRVPEYVQQALIPIKSDDQLVKDYGVNLAVEMIRKLVAEGGIPGVHFCTLNLEKSTQRILESLQWTGAVAPYHNRLITEAPPTPTVQVDPGLIVNPAIATHDAAQSLASLPTMDGEVGKGELNNAATWDDFPNGRFGDIKSPAFGAQDPWGGNGFATQLTGALKQWHDPKSFSDLTNIFLDYLHGKISTTPFYTLPLSPESLTILPELERLTRRGWWTVGSQPAVDAVSSTDEVVGWGPKNGYVFQKCFVEFFCDKEDVEMIEKMIEKRGNGLLHYFAGNYTGDFKTNVPEDGRNAVTWGIFLGQEVIQTTIIEQESFLAWKDEAFSIWADWASCYRPDSQERKLLEHVRDHRWLISIVHHDYRNPRALWDFMFEENGV